MTLALPLRPLFAGALLALNLGAIAAPTSIVFDTTPRAGQHQRQLMDMQAVMKMRVEPGEAATEEERAKIAQAAERMSQMGPMKMSMQMQQTLKVGQADADGWLPMTVATVGQGVKLEVGGKAVPVPAPKTDVGFVARFNPRDFAFEIREVQGSPELSEMMRQQGNTTVAQALQLFKTLKERPLKVGDSVDVPLKMNLPVPMPGAAGGMDGVVHYTLARLERGVAYFDLAMDLKLDINTPIPTPPGAASAPQGEAASATATPPKMLHMVINGGGKGHSALRLADRLALNSKLDMDMQMTVDMPDNGRMLMDMSMVMQSKGESLAKPVAAKKAP
ncbi:hypothetical protein ACS5PN_23605 [Roseateles sp. NT4]|uniref:hypothetical protein n=1 Tax=Roseateles sp. NT4 TaxID=3453715 RepID=UPI003EE926F7